MYVVQDLDCVKHPAELAQLRMHLVELVPVKYLKASISTLPRSELVNWVTAVFRTFSYLRSRRQRTMFTETSKDGTHTVDMDAEKALPTDSPTQTSSDVDSNGANTGRFAKLNRRIEGMAGFEARGLERVPLEERQPLSAMGLVQMHLLWLSANLTINNMAVAMTCNVVFGLGFADSAACAVAGVFLGSLTTAYMSTFGACSGNRTMVRTMIYDRLAPFWD